VLSFNGETIASLVGVAAGPDDGAVQVVAGVDLAAGLGRKNIQTATADRLGRRRSEDERARVCLVEHPVVVVPVALGDLRVVGRGALTDPVRGAEVQRRPGYRRYLPSRDEPLADGRITVRVDLQDVVICAPRCLAGKVPVSVVGHVDNREDVGCRLYAKGQAVLVVQGVSSDCRERAWEAHLTRRAHVQKPHPDLTRRLLPGCVPDPLVEPDVAAVESVAALICRDLVRSAAKLKTPSRNAVGHPPDNGAEIRAEPVGVACCRRCVVVHVLLKALETEHDICQVAVAVWELNRGDHPAKVENVHSHAVGVCKGEALHALAGHLPLIGFSQRERRGRPGRGHRSNLSSPAAFGQALFITQYAAVMSEAAPKRAGPQGEAQLKQVGKRRWTITDVAERAGVSVGTASKALNGRGNLRAETRLRVIHIADSLGFQPNALARSLLAGRSFTVGLLTTDSFGRFSIPMMLGAEDALGEGSISVFLCDGRGNLQRERRYVQTLLSRRVDGIIVAGRRVDPRPPVGTELPVPVVYAMAQSEDRQDLCVLPDDEGGGDLAVSHLIDLGRARIAHISGPEHFEGARRRARGAMASLARAGLAMAGGGPLFGHWTEAWGREATAQLLQRAPRADAIFCGSDQIARGVSDALKEAGRRIPEDVSLVGFDNWEPMVEGCRPALTTVDPNLTEVGRVAARELLAAIERGTPGGVLTVSPKLVVRESTAAVGTPAAPRRRSKALGQVSA